MAAPEVKDDEVKILFVGNSGVGKTSLLQRFVSDKYIDVYRATAGIDFASKEMTVDGKQVKLQLWDTAGQERYKSLTSTYYRGSQACVLVFDVTEVKSFLTLDTWRDDFLKQVNPAMPEKFPFVILGNKVDLENRAVSARQAQAWCTSKDDLPYFETSAKDNVNVEQALEEVVRRALANGEESPPEEETSKEPVKLNGKEPSSNTKKEGCMC